MAHIQEPQVTVLPPNKEKIKKLWRVAGILGIITAFEFLIAFTMAHGPLKTSIFVGMTIIKAAYIVGEFMHLRYESKVLLWAILIPLIFVVWMLVAFIYEGMKLSIINF
ncbi:MAG: cytochrome C oxidase subunit IV family protein [Cyclobacteriaceae bacterium]|nr:cytochrome C oxidase subunit IV family protein [Cyclobacteriaceae bacterium]MCB9236818.1 cytochrome C oxidase subunit IV family protein [Flammeovirgaceae bacterium]MCB0498615.1 cytochrome C oxidase subunit IV family protein [Cyclobacteriaceae bacterium]MCO5271580.1 cytochrome C oxidase subunit IV family protein [Cyclobacteriaceae bacterium]MCW5901475.1 cytochrome C oxidase subunit IV family protein [Cyclobacteriaceae bacterium]